MASMKEQPLELAVIVKGEIVESNFSEFELVIDNKLKSIKTNLKTDADFGQAVLDIKAMKTAETAIIEAKIIALEQMESVNDLFTKLDEKGEAVRTFRLNHEKKVKAKTDEVKKGIEDHAVNAINNDNPEAYRSNITEAMKGIRKLDNLKKAADEKAAEINALHEVNCQILDAVIKDHGAGIVPDLKTLLDEETGALRDQVARRVELAIAEKERKRLAAELEERNRKEAAQAKAKEPTSLVDTEDTLAIEPTPIPGQLPEPRKVDSLPTNRPAAQTTPEPAQEETQQEEAERFIRNAMASFASFRLARLALKHPKNIEAGKAFAFSIGTSWNDFADQTS